MHARWFGHSGSETHSGLGAERQSCRPQCEKKSRVMQKYEKYDIHAKLGNINKR